jgi:hypothetical protein
MFGSAYAVYTVKTAPYNWEVSRRFSDFEWLREILVKIFPSFIIPPIPEKSALVVVTAEIAEKRRQLFELFLK